MTKVHNIGFKGGGKWGSITYQQKNVLHEGDIIKATFDLVSYKGDKTIAIRHCPHPRDSVCDKCPLYVDEIVQHDYHTKTCAAHRWTGKGVRSICSKGCANKPSFIFVDMDDILEDL